MPEAVIPYRPRPQFISFHNSTARFAVVCAHRRAGKTVAVVNRLIESVFTCDKPRPRVYYIAPTYTQAKRIAWDYAKHYSRSLPGIKINESELRIDYPNEGRFQLLGADNPDGARGIYADDVGIDEYAFMSPLIWTQIIRPALSDRKGRAVFISSVNGPNAFYDLYCQAAADESWQRWMLKASETGIIADDELKALKREMPDDDYRQEYECDFSVAIKGALFGTLMQEAEDEGRIMKVPFDPGLPVQTWWDLGVADPSAIWVTQQSGGETRCIDYIENTGIGLEDYIAELRKRGYMDNPTPAVWPHDGAQREFGLNGASRQDTAAKLGLKTQVLANTPEGDQVQAARVLLPKCVFDREKTEAGRAALSQARREYNEKRKIFGPKMLHDWASHGTKAFMYGALAVRPQLRPQRQRAQRRRAGSATSWMAA